MNLIIGKIGKREINTDIFQLETHTDAGLVNPEFSAKTARKEYRCCTIRSADSGDSTGNNERKLTLTQTGCLPFYLPR